MINAPDSKLSRDIKCSICRSPIHDRHRMYQSSLKLGVICKECRHRFSPDDVEMIVSLFFAYGGHFGQFEKSSLSIDDLIVEFVEQIGTGRSTFHSQNLKMWHKVLTHGITPEEFLRELSLIAE